jgi:hypothetical protein
MRIGELVENAGGDVGYLTGRLELVEPAARR